MTAAIVRKSARTYFAHRDALTVTPRVEIDLLDATEVTEALSQVFAGAIETMDGGLRLIADGIKRGAPKALGKTNAEWANELLPQRHLPSVMQRRALIAELAEEGMSGPEIAAVVGVSDQTVYRDLSGSSTNVEPAADDTRSDAGVVGSGSTFVEPDDEADDPLWWDDDPFTERVVPSKPIVTPHIAHNSGEHEWYTPREYIDAARSVLGEIDLDPASSAEANECVRASRFYTIEDDGLQQPWAGRLWMNPPYAQPAVDRFCTRLAREYAQGAVSEAISLVNNATETAWLQEMAAQCSAVCFPRGRVKFWQPGKVSAAPLQGQAVVYLGRNPEVFRAAFVRFGSVARWEPGQRHAAPQEAA